MFRLPFFTRKKKPARVFVVLGPQGVINAITALRYDLSKGGLSKNQDILLMGPFCCGEKEAAEMKEICLKIASIWPFAKIIEADSFSNKVWTNPGEFLPMCMAIREAVGDVEVESVFVTFNGQLPHELALGAFPSARRVGFGGGQGHLISDTSFGDRCYNPEGYLPLTDAYVTTPVLYEAVSKKPPAIHIMEPSFYRGVIEDAAHCFDEMGKIEEVYSKLAERSPLSLLLMGNYTEASMTPDEEAELNMYMDVILPFLVSDETVILKRHPRQNASRAVKLQERLRARGFDSVVMTEGEQLPIEMVALKLPLARLFGIRSTGSVMTANFLKCPVQVGIGETIAAKYFQNVTREQIITFPKMMKVLVQQAQAGEFKTIDQPTFEKDYPGLDSEPEMIHP